MTEEASRKIKKNEVRRKGRGFRGEKLQ